MPNKDPTSNAEKMAPSRHPAAQKKRSAFSSGTQGRPVERFPTPGAGSRQSQGGLHFQTKKGPCCRDPEIVFGLFVGIGDELLEDSEDS